MPINSRGLGRISYSAALEEQTLACNCKRPEILWFESEPVITLGLRAEAPSAPTPSDCEILRVNRGGAATYHGPGQLVVFPALHLPTIGFTVREWVCHLLKTTQSMLREYGIEAEWDLKRPGLYTRSGKIAAVGLKIQNGWSHHGLALNVKGDLKPFQAIHACGVANAQIDQMSAWLGEGIDLESVFQSWLAGFVDKLPARHDLSL